MVACSEDSATIIIVSTVQCPHITSPKLRMATPMVVIHIRTTAITMVVTSTRTMATSTVSLTTSRTAVTRTKTNRVCWVVLHSYCEGCSKHRLFELQQTKEGLSA